MENRAWKFVDPFVLVRSLKDLSRNVIWFSYRLKMSENEMFWEKRKKTKQNLSYTRKEAIGITERKWYGFDHWDTGLRDYMA